MTSISIDIKNTLEHYQGLADELKTGERHSCHLCAPIHAICATCRVEIKSTWGAARAKGWVEIEGDDYCPNCDPV